MGLPNHGVAPLHDSIQHQIKGNFMLFPTVPVWLLYFKNCGNGNTFIESVQKLALANWTFFEDLKFLSSNSFVHYTSNFLCIVMLLPPKETTIIPLSKETIVSSLPKKIRTCAWFKCKEPNWKTWVCYNSIVKNKKCSMTSKLLSFTGSPVLLASQWNFHDLEPINWPSDWNIFGRSKRLFGL